MFDDRPWTDPRLLADLLAGWRGLWGGRPVFRVAAGQDWIRIGLEGDSRPGILLTRLPEASLVLAHAGRLPAPVAAALPPARNHPLTRLLQETAFSSCAMFPGDRVAAFRFTRPQGDRLYLLHQLFGARSNTALLDEQAVLLWARHRPPHSLLAAVPPGDIWEHGTPADPADTVSPAAFEHLTDRLLHRTARETGTVLDRGLKSALRLVENLARDHDRAEKGELFRRKAEALATHLHTLSAGAASVEVADPRNGEPLVIALDPGLSPAANLEAWFRRARKAEKGREVIAGRLAAARRSCASFEAAAAEMQDLSQGTDSALDRLASLQAWRAVHSDLLPGKKSGAAAGRYGPEEPARPFRRYLVDGRWEVWVGRNNRENDELTHRASHGRDIWLHAQGVPGSHVILRTAGRPDLVPRSVLAKAAALAALNSRARHAEMVPVVHTERRYVRKPRKAPPGTAVCLREKSMFATPRVAPGVVTI